MLDYDLAPYVGKSYLRNCAEFVTAALGVDSDYLKTKFVKVAEKKFNLDHLHDCTAEIRELMKEVVHNYPTTIEDEHGEMSELDCQRMIKFADKKTIKDTHQAMESLVHNLCTMQCFPKYEDLWVYDTAFDQWCIYTFEELHHIFTPGRFFVLSVNPTSGELEMKAIQDCVARFNDKKMVAVNDASGAGYVSTFDHRYMTSNEDLTLGYTPAASTTHVTMPRKFKIPTLNRDTGMDVSEFSARGVRINTPCIGHTFVSYTLELAELLGYWVADGWVSPDLTMLGFAVDIKVPYEHILQLFEKAFGFKPVYRVRNRIDAEGQERLHALMISCGVHLGRCVTLLAGKRASSKHVPNFVLTGSQEMQNAFLRAYLICDGNHHNNSLDFSTVSRSLIYDIRLIFLSRGEMLHVGCRTGKTTPQGNPAQPLYTGSTGCKAAERLGLADTVESKTAFEIPKYDNSDATAYARKLGVRWGDGADHLVWRDGKQVYYSELENLSQAHEGKPGMENLEIRSHVFNMPVTQRFDAPDEEIVYDISVADNENFVLANGAIVHNSRAGSQTPFSSVNFGTCTSWEGRAVSDALLDACDAGLGNGETAIFPITIFKMKKSVNGPGAVNYDLFQKSCRVSAKRMLPNWVNLDAPYNAQYYKEGDPRTEVATMGCRTRVISNVYDPDNAICYGRGNLFWSTINLPYLALEAKEEVKPGQDLYKLFMHKLDTVFDQLVDYSDDRLKIISQRKAKNYPFMMGQHEYVGSEGMQPDDTIGDVIKNGTISFGFIGLAETLLVLTGHHHGESEESQRVGLEIVRHLRARCDALSKERTMNYSLMGTPAEGCTGRLCRAIENRWGVIKGITDKSYLVNSSHLPPTFKVSAFDKTRIEVPYHELENAGHILYIQLTAEAAQNEEGFEELVQFMADSGAGYFAINHPVHRDPVCGYVGPLNPDGSCPRCGRKNGEGVPVSKLLSLTSYSPDPDYAVTAESLEQEDAVPQDLT